MSIRTAHVLLPVSNATPNAVAQIVAKTDRRFSMTNRVLVVRLKETNRIVCQLNPKTENESVPAGNTRRRVLTSVGAKIATMEKNKHVLVGNEACVTILLPIKERRHQNEWLR